MIFFDTCSGRFMDANVENVNDLKQRVEEVNNLYTQEGWMSVKEYYDRINVDDRWLPIWSFVYRYGGFSSSIKGTFSVETAEELRGEEVVIVLTPGCLEPE